MLKKLFSHTLVYGLAPQVVRIAQIFVLPIITPFLTTADYGVFGLIAAVLGAVSIFSNLGLNIVLSNSFTKSPHQYKWLWRQIYGFLSLWSIIYAFIVAFVIYLFIPNIAKADALMIIILNVLPLVLFGPTGVIGSMYYQLKQQPFQIMVRSVCVGLITLVLNIYFIKYLKMGYMGWFWAAAISQILEHFSYFIPLNFKLKITPIFNFKWRTIKKQILICLPTIPHYYSGYLLGSFDRIIMKFYKVDIQSIGKYNMAFIPSGIFTSGTYAINQAIGPLLLQSYKNGDKKTEVKLNFISAIIVLILTSTVCLFVKEILPLIIRSKGLEDVYKIAIVLIMASNSRPMYIAANNKLFFLEKTKALLKVTTIAAGISVVLNIICIYYFGFKAAAFTLFLCNMYIGYSGFFIKEYKESDNANHSPLIWLVVTLGLTALVYLAADLSIITKSCIALPILLIGGIAAFKIHKKYSV